ncbi:hypothetical protein D922_04038 [Enterococcus faecalis 06-MB-DW-09]|nr:hypothetical protein D922_04038 [Enterococcus faecalis 06-MB-DW-09]
MRATGENIFRLFFFIKNKKCGGKHDSCAMLQILLDNVIKQSGGN